MKHMKRILAIMLALIMVLSTVTVLTVGAVAENEPENAVEVEEQAATPALYINYCNLVLTANVEIVYAVEAENIDISTTGVKLLVWKNVPADYTDGSQDVTIESDASQNIGGVEHVVFEFAELGAINMVDYYYAVAYAEVDGTPVYSAPLKYSVLEYAYTILGKNGGEAYGDAKLHAAIEALLNYGAAMQVLRNHNTNKLANGAYSYIDAENAVMADGFGYGICALNEKVTLTATTEANQMVHNWVDENGNLVYSTSSTYQATAPATEGETATYAAEIVGKSAGGNFVYELEAKPAPVVVDGVKDKLYDENGFSLPAKHVMPKTTDTFDVYFTADESYVYVFYDFQKNYTAHYNESYAYKYHLDCVDFVLRADGAEESGNTGNTEFRINAKLEDHSGTITTKPYNNSTTVTLNYSVKHKDPNGEDKGYYVEFAIPLNKVTGTDANGNKMLSFTALSTMNTTDPANWGGTTNPGPTYSCAWKAKGTATSQAKESPSFIVIKEGTQVNEPDTKPSSIVYETVTNEEGKEEQKPKNFVYEITKSNVPLTVDGTKDASYANGIHQVSKLGYGSRSTKSLFDMYITADSGRVYVLYEFTKEMPICYDTITSSNHWWYDNVDFVANVTNAFEKGTEFKIFGGVEGGKGTAATYGMPAWVDNYYVKHTSQGYNVEFSIPLSKITSVDADGNKQFGYLATATMNYETASARCNPTTNNALGLGAANDNGTKTHLSVVVIKNEFELEETTDTIIQDGYMDAAYANGIYAPSVHNNPDENNRFDCYITADDEYVYGLYIVKDTNIIRKGVNGEGKNYPYYGDCIDFCYNVDGLANGTDKEFRIWGAIEGTDHYLTKNADGTYVYEEILSRSIDKAGETGLALVDSYTVVHTEDGYNVEFKIARSRFTDPDMFSFIAVATAASSETSRVYPHMETSNNSASKNHKSVVVIVPAN